MIEAITFDFWNTLVVARADQMATNREVLLHEILTEHGVEADRAGVAAALDIARLEYLTSWRADIQFGANDAVRTVVRELGVPVSDSIRQEMVAAIQSGDTDPQLMPHVLETLSRLKNAGLRVGIICDVALSPSTLLRQHLSRHEALDYFDHWSFSDEVGHYKPSPKIFEHAHRGLGVSDPANAAHVGDMRRTDVAGARNYGVRSIRYAGVVDDQEAGPEADYVITDHAELPPILGIGESTRSAVRTGIG